MKLNTLMVDDDLGNGGSNSLPTVSPNITLKSIVFQWPEFLLHMLPYIADRGVWNAIVGTSKSIYLKSKEETFPFPLPPWPMNFKLRVPFYPFPQYTIDNPVCSPDGTEIACIVSFDWQEFSAKDDDENDGEDDDDDNDETDNFKIVIFHQRWGPISFHRRGGNDNNNNNNNNIINNNIGWIVHVDEYDCEPEPMELRYSPDGTFLISAGEQVVKVWNYNSIDGSYQNLYEWNLYGELGVQEQDQSRDIIKVDVSPCSEYIVLLVDQHIILKDIQNKGETIKSTLLPDNEWGHQIDFSNVGVCGHYSIFIRSGRRYYYYLKTEIDEEGKRKRKMTRFSRILNIIKIWHPFTIVNRHDDDPTSASITILEQTNSTKTNRFIMSNKKSMLAMYYHNEKEGVLELHIYSIDDMSATKRLSLKQSYSMPLSSTKKCTSAKFTPDDNYLYCHNEDGFVFLDVQSGQDVTKQMHNSYNKNGYYSSEVDSMPANDSVGRFKFIYDKGYHFTSFWKK